MILNNIIRSGVNFTSKRFVRKKPLKSWPNDWVPFHWNRPEKIPGYYLSGDLVDRAEPDKMELLPDFRNSEQLKALNPDDPLRKLFSLSHARVADQTKAYSREGLRRLGLVHELPSINSMEAKIIRLTYTIRHLQDKIRRRDINDNFNGNIRLAANSYIGRRERYLRDLKELHTERYERIVKALDLEPKEVSINTPYIPVYRKIQMRRLAIEYARDLKEKKVEDYIKSLESEKLEFKKEKAATLKWIEEKEQELSAQTV